MLIIDPEREAKRILNRFEVIHPPVNVESIARGLGLWVVYKEMEPRTLPRLMSRKVNEAGLTWYRRASCRTA